MIIKCPKCGDIEFFFDAEDEDNQDVEFVRCPICDEDIPLVQEKHLSEEYSLLCNLTIINSILLLAEVILLVIALTIVLN